jgi:UDP-N-acetylmuramoyl-tripeptide--D-alanyl-D-alanine ligase
MNHAGEIEQLVQLIHPHIALITQVSYQHGQFFSSIDAIVDAKAEIFSGLPPLVGILPHDSPHYSALRNQERNNVTGWITFGRHSASNVRLISTVCQGDKTQVTIEINKEQLSYHWPLDGAHTLDNSLAIVAGAWAIGADMHQVMNDLSTITPSKGRGSRLNLRGISIIDESYNAAPASMHAVLTAFAQEQCPGKRYLLLGEMRELGAQSYALHSALIPLMHACCLDGVWLCGNEFQPFLEEVPQLCGHGLGIDDLLPSILETLRPGDCILIKGANCMRTFALIDALKE